MTDLLEPVFKQYDTHWWLERLERLSIGCGPINKLSDLFSGPQVNAHNNTIEIQHSYIARCGWFSAAIWRRRAAG